MPVYQNEKTGIYYWKETFDGKQIKKTNKKWIRPSYAQKDLDEYKRKLTLGIIKKDSIKFNELVEQYYSFIDLKYKKSTFLKTTNLINKYLIPFFGNKKVMNITPANIYAFQKSLLELNNDGVPFKNSHLERIQTITKQVFEFAVNHDYIHKNPFLNTVKVKHNTPEIKKEITILTYQEYSDFISYVDDPIYKMVFSILYWCGLRSGELLALTIQDYDIDKKTLTVNKNFDEKNRIITVTKNRGNRVIDVPKQCALDIETVLASAKEAKAEPNAPLIGITHRIPKTTLQRRKNTYIKESNSKHFTFHDLRHTHVSTLIDIGWEAKDISDRLGHSVEMVNNTYGHLFPDRKKANMEKLNKLIE